MRKQPTFESIAIGGTEYVSCSVIARQLGVSRQTIWRWRKVGKVPQGHLYRSSQLVFTVEEAVDVYAYGTRVEPAETTNSDQLPLFQPKAHKRGSK
jgi:transposase-like protein